MGGTSSRVGGSQPPRRSLRQIRHPKPTFSSFFKCGGGISSMFICGSGTPYPNEIEDDQAENSAEHGVLDKFRNPRKDSSVSSSAVSRSSSPELQMRRSTSKTGTASSILQSRDGSSDETLINRQVNDISSSPELGESSSDESSNEIQGTAVMTFSNFGSSSASNISDSPFSNCISRAASGLSLSERGMLRRDDNLVLGDVASSSEVFATSSRRDMERRNRRLCRDALSSRSRGYLNSRNYLLSNDDFDNLGHHDMWLHDFSRDFLGEGVGGSLRSYENGTQGIINHQWHSTSEISGSTRGALEINATTSRCPSGIHPRGPCSCESILRGESLGSRASISRIVMLAEALFEVLDEVHRQPLSGPLPVVSVPAEVSVVNSLPIKNYIKPEESVCSDDAAKCYICLDEYEDGDNVRTLPCQHEYHVSCIDKWLKEIHGICPLCRADVKEGFTKSFNST